MHRSIGHKRDLWIVRAFWTSMLTITAMDMDTLSPIMDMAMDMMARMATLPRNQLTANQVNSSSNPPMYRVEQMGVMCIVMYLHTLHGTNQRHIYLVHLPSVIRTLSSTATKAAIHGR